MDLSAIIVNYESWPDTVMLTHRLLQAAADAGLALEVVVVDNGSVEHPLAKTLESLPGVYVVMVGENVGFATGVNRGWQHAQSRFLLVMNPDLVLTPGFLASVAQWVRRLKSQSPSVRKKPPDAFRGRAARMGAPVGIVGFRLLSLDGRVQHSTGFFPTIWWTVVGQLFPRARRKYRPGPRRRGPVDWVSGACFLADRRVFEDLGGMDENFFLYYEEVDLCWRTWQRGWRVLHDPQPAVIHLRPLERRSVPPALRVVLRHSLLYYFRKNLPGWHFLLLAGVVWTQALAGRCAAALLPPLRDTQWVWRAVQATALQMVRQWRASGNRMRHAPAVAQGAGPPHYSAATKAAEATREARAPR